MSYRFATTKQDYAPFASGQVLYSAPNQPAFSVRLSSELFQRCAAILGENGRFPPYTLYDPCVGSGTHLVTLAYLHWQQIDRLIGSDINPAVQQFAAKNFSLLTPTGLATRAEAIKADWHAYGKASHQQSLAYAQQFQQTLRDNLQKHEIATTLFAANALQDLRSHWDAHQLPAPDIVLCDVPYGAKTAWQGVPSADDVPVTLLLEQLLGVIRPYTIIALATDKAQTCRHPQFQRLAKFQIGKRRLWLFKKS